MFTVLSKQTSGMAAIITVVIIGVVALLIVNSITTIGIDALSSGYNTSQAGETLALAEGCADETLRRWQLDSNYQITDANLILGSGQCTISALGNATDLDINVVGQVGNFYKTLTITATKASGTPITIESWEEISG